MMVGLQLHRRDLLDDALANFHGPGLLAGGLPGNQPESQQAGECVRRKAA
jgi:hypothetical protein